MTYFGLFGGAGNDLNVPLLEDLEHKEFAGPSSMFRARNTTCRFTASSIVFCPCLHLYPIYVYIYLHTKIGLSIYIHIYIHISIYARVCV